VTDVLRRQVPVLFAVPARAIQHINAGKLRPLAITGATRFKSLPAVPTFVEVGRAGRGWNDHHRLRRSREDAARRGHDARRYASPAFLPPRKWRTSSPTSACS
jgi:hypothetical protein